MALIPLTNEERYVLWGILNRYPDVIHKRVKLNWGIFRPSVSLHGILEWLFGQEI